jgi:hypothetical protein
MVVLAYHQQIIIFADEVIGFCHFCTGEENIILWIAANRLDVLWLDFDTVCLIEN